MIKIKKFSLGYVGLLLAIGRQFIRLCINIIGGSSGLLQFFNYLFS